jgi:hypothetical protein
VGVDRRHPERPRRRHALVPVHDEVGPVNLDDVDRWEVSGREGARDCRYARLDRFAQRVEAAVEVAAAILCSDMRAISTSRMPASDPVHSRSRRRTSSSSSRGPQALTAPSVP